MAVKTDFQMPTVALMPFALSGSEAEIQLVAANVGPKLSVAMACFEEFRLVKPSKATSDHPNYILDCSLSAQPDQVEIGIQLIDAVAGRPVWSDRFTKTVDSVQNSPDEIITLIASTTGLAVLKEQGQAIEGRADDALNVNEITLRGLQHLQRLNPQDNLTARRYFDRAIAMAPREYIPALGLCISFANELANGWPNGRIDTLGYALELAQDVLKRNANSGHAQRAVSCLLLLGGSFKQGLIHAQRAWQLNPYSGDMAMIHALAQALNGKPAEGVKKMEWCMEINPYAPVYFNVYLSLAYYLVARHEDGLSILEGIDTNVGAARILEIVHLNALDRQSEAAEMAKTLLHEYPGFRIKQLVKDLPFTSEEQREGFAEILSAVELPQ